MIYNVDVTTYWIFHSNQNRGNQINMTSVEAKSATRNNWHILDVTVSGEISCDDTEDTLTYTWTHNSTFSITLAVHGAPDRQ